MEEQVKTVQKEIEDLQKQKKTIEDKIQELNQKVLDLYTIEQKRLANGLETLRAEQKQLNKTISSFGNRIKLDVGGKTFATTLATLTKFPESMLGAMFSGRFAIKPEEDGFIFIDRNGDHFSVILDFLRDGKVSLPSEPAHLENLRTEADYFRIDKLVEHIDEKLGVNAVSVLSGSSGTGELSWSDTKKGRNIALSNNNCVAKMEGNLWSYGSVFANVSFSSGNHYWEVKVDYSTDDMIGVTQCKVSDCTAMHVSHKEDVCFVGHGDGALYGKGRRSYGTQKPLVKDIYKPIDDVIGILLQFQGQRSTLSYFKNGEYLFEIYTGMTGEVTPAVELYESPAQVTLVRYMNLSASGDAVAHVKKLWNTNKSGSSSAYFM